MGRLTKDPEIRYSQSSEPLAIVRYTLAANRRFKREGQQDVDYINCTAFGKTGEFAEKYFVKGQQISIVGRLQVRSWDDQEGKKHWATDVVVEEQYFAESKKQTQQNSANNSSAESHEGFYPIDESMEDDDLPF